MNKLKHNPEKIEMLTADRCDEASVFDGNHRDNEYNPGSLNAFRLSVDICGQECTSFDW